MTNQERQKSLDKKKWIESEKQGKDMTGNMDYCNHCYYQEICRDTQFIPQEEREEYCLCAKAYNRMKRTER